WFFRAKITLIENSESARLEVDRAAHAVDAPVSGRIVFSRLSIGAEVEEGEVLMELDGEPERRRLQEARTRLATIGPQITALRRSVAAEERTILNDRSASGVAVDEARARREEAEMGRALSANMAARARTLWEDGAIAEVELLRSKTEADQRRASSLA